ncbi:glycine-tRNA synthetase, beta subunit [Candidatus Blochmanniella floridana]|uniref:Glycine--tRNA ligase beta subunit n=1 Tax=Blochmanniella floridana TaxID=203907 RepID=Q7VQU4_BLOFL|nr:glycine-tRNA synthetase, beta subunit [Candidatus Blochmannia floridanus]
MLKHIFLVAIGIDELPSKFVKKLGQDFYYHIINEFKKNNIYYKKTYWFSAPRHLAVQSEISIIENQDLSMFCEKNVDFVNSVNDFIKNKSLNLLLINIINNALNRLVHYEMMRWSSVNTSFVRPVNTVTVLLDTNLVQGNIFETEIDRIIYGHRYVKNNKIILGHAKDYPSILSKQGCIIVDYQVRKETIRLAVKEQASKIGGAIDERDEKFLDEITSLVEWPVVLCGKFNKRFLELPNELIIHIMKCNQKYFPVYDQKSINILLPYFIVVVNTITNDYSKIIAGHENIIKMRLMDAEYFIKKDSRYRLIDYIPKLKSIVFHSKLGSILDKVNRITELAGWIAEQIHEDIIDSKRAAYLCKCDLVTDVVLEFPEVQGIIGMYYARRDRESEKVAIAQKEHYQPKYVTDKLPMECISCIVSIADRIDTISGIFGIQEFPTGSRDPFGLKRAATGILNIFIQKKISLNLLNLIHKSVMLYGPKLINVEDIKNHIYSFMCKRLGLYYYSLGYKKNIVKSVLNTDISNIAYCNDRIDTINSFYNMKIVECAMINTLYKRISNILKNQKIYHCKIEDVDVTILLYKDMRLFEKITEFDRTIRLLFDKNCYDIILEEMVNLSKLTHNFIDTVLILHDDQLIKTNRLILLNVIKKLIYTVVDISVLCN